MKNIIGLLLVFTFPMTAKAAIKSFSCKTLRPIEDNRTRTISFRLNFRSAKDVSIDSIPGRKDFKIVPYSDALRALNTGDNNGVDVQSDRILIYGDEIDMYHTDLVLWKNSRWQKGFVRTSGQSNEPYYSPITCEVNGSVH